MVRSLLAAERSSWLVGVLVGWIVDRLAVCWPVSVGAVIAVDMNEMVPEVLNLARGFCEVCRESGSQFWAELFTIARCQIHGCGDGDSWFLYGLVKFRRLQGNRHGICGECRRRVAWFAAHARTHTETRS